MTRERKCHECGCTDADCSGCIARTGIPCSWSDVEHDLCTACEELGPPEPTSVTLDDASFGAFSAAIAKPPAPNKKLRDLMAPKRGSRGRK